MDSFSYELTAAKAIALRAGDIMLAHFDGSPIERKEDDSPVTVADREINHMVIVELAKHFDDGVIGEEESTADYGMGRRWICDPIDGTRAFTWGVPTAMFSLALVIDGVPVLGVAYDPFLKMLFEATTGAGSFVNGKRMQVSDEKTPGADIAVSSNVEFTITDANQARLVRNLMSKKVRLVCFSGAVYKGCLLARGRIDGYVESHVNPHDVAAIEVIVREAGGIVTGYDGKPLDYTKNFKGAVLSNGATHADLLSSIE